MYFLHITGFIVSFFCYYEAVKGNPCDSVNHKPFPEAGSRNIRCTNLTNVCDFYLLPGWYVSPRAVLVNICPSSGSCGVTFPAWMKGDFPSVTDGIVDRTACVVRKGDCCRDTFPMQVKNCSSYYVYHLRSLRECPSAYCFGSTLPCTNIMTVPPVTSSESTDKPKGDKEGDKENGKNKGILIGILSSVGVLLLQQSRQFCKQRRESWNIRRTPECRSTSCKPITPAIV